MKDINKIVVFVLVLSLVACMNTNVIEGFYELSESVKESKNPTN